MALTSQNVSDNLAGMMHSTGVKKIVNLNELKHRAGMNVLSKIDPLETIRVQNITNPIHDDVFEYSAPSDFKDIIDLRPQVNRTERDNPVRVGSKRFSLKKALEDRTVQIKHDSGTTSLRINIDISPSPVILHTLNDLDGNGTWEAAGSAANVAEESIYYVSGSKSIKFTHTASADGIQITDMTAVDLTDHDEISELFVWVYVPDVTNLTSVTMLWGNDLTTNYWTGAAQTAQADGTAFRNGWNLIKFTWSGATETGTVAPATIDSIRITLASSAALGVCRVDNIISSIGKIWEIEYYSKYIWRNSSGTFIQKPTTSSDILNLDESSYMIYLNELKLLAAQQLQGPEATQDKNDARLELYGDDRQPGLYISYTRKHPSQAMKRQTKYYSISRV